MNDSPSNLRAESRISLKTQFSEFQSEAQVEKRYSWIGLLLNDREHRIFTGLEYAWAAYIIHLKS